ncbi:acyl-CoA thioesterase [Kitasatospora sp. NPDC057223]|uniref:acyl-CoA thioesterase n=1 Tax=Kitasatospora sp. NPDC057223 TaxID=3346055 RepID=UPI003631F14A
MSGQPTTLFQKSFEVRWDDVDVNGHLRNTRYLEYASTARMALLAAHGWTVRDLLKEGYTAVMLGEEAQYLAEVLPAEWVEVSCEFIAGSEDGSRFRFRHVISRADGSRAAVVHAMGAWLSLANRRIFSPPEPLRKALESLRTADYAPLGAER